MLITKRTVAVDTLKYYFLGMGDPEFTRWGGGAPTPGFWTKTYYLARFFSENYMKMKEVGQNRGCASLAQPWIRQYFPYIDSAWRGFLINDDWSASPETTELTNGKIFTN